MLVWGQFYLFGFFGPYLKAKFSFPVVLPSQMIIMSHLEVASKDSHQPSNTSNVTKIALGITFFKRPHCCLHLLNNRFIFSTYAIGFLKVQGFSSPPENSHCFVTWLSLSPITHFMGKHIYQEACLSPICFCFLLNPHGCTIGLIRNVERSIGFNLRGLNFSPIVYSVSPYYSWILHL